MKAVTLVRRRCKITLEVCDHEVPPQQNATQAVKDGAYAMASALRLLAADMEKQGVVGRVKANWNSKRPGQFDASWISALVRWACRCKWCGRLFWSRRRDRDFCSPLHRKLSIMDGLARKKASGVPVRRPRMKVRLEPGMPYVAKHHVPVKVENDE